MYSSMFASSGPCAQRILRLHLSTYVKSSPDAPVDNGLAVNCVMFADAASGIDGAVQGILGKLAGRQ